MPPRYLQISQANQYPSDPGIVTLVPSPDVLWRMFGAKDPYSSRTVPAPDENIGGYAASDQDGVRESQFRFRRPVEALQRPATGFPGNFFPPFHGIQLPGAGFRRPPEKGLSVGYSSGSSERPPVGMHPKFVQFMAERGTPVPNFKIDETSYNVGIAAHLPGGVLPKFMEGVLRPKQVNASYSRSRQAVTTPPGKSSDNTNRGREIGGQGQILRHMFGNYAPTVSLQYSEPNLYDRNFSGSVEVPVGSGIFSVSGRKSLNEGRRDESAWRIGYGTKF